MDRRNAKDDAPPNFYRGLKDVRLNAICPSPPPFYLEPERKCRNVKDELLQGRGREQRSEMPIHHRLSQPTTGGHVRYAEMPYTYRLKGRAIHIAQKCHTSTASPNQLQGVNTITQKCQTNVAPTEFGPSALRRNAVSRSPNNQRPSHARRNAILQTPRK